MAQVKNKTNSSSLIHHNTSGQLCMIFLDVVREVEAVELTDGQRLKGLGVAELALALPVDSGYPHLVRRVGLQPRQHHRRCKHKAEIELDSQRQWWHLLAWSWLDWLDTGVCVGFRFLVWLILKSWVGCIWVHLLSRKRTAMDCSGFLTSL